MCICICVFYIRFCMCIYIYIFIYLYIYTLIRLELLIVFDTETFRRQRMYVKSHLTRSVCIAPTTFRRRLFTYICTTEKHARNLELFLLLSCPILGCTVDR